MVPVESVAAAGMRPNWVKPKRRMRAMEPTLSAKMMPQALHMWRARASVSSLSSMNVPTPPALPCRIDVIGQIGDAVIPGTIVEHGERTEADD